MPALSAPPSPPVPSRSARPSPRPTPPAPSPIYRLPADALLVGPGHKYAKPCQAIAAAKPGATIGIDAKGNPTYNGDVCAWSTDRLTIAGFNGIAHIDAAGRSAQLPTIVDAAPVDTIILELGDPDTPYGLRGVGEMPSISSTPAILAALRAATGREVTRAPARPEDLIA